MENWNGITDEQLNEVAQSKSEKEFIESIQSLEDVTWKMRSCAETQRIKAGNDIMNFVTEYYQEEEKEYKERYGHDYIEAMRQDETWVWLAENKEFQKLLKNYFEHVIG